MLSCLRQKQKVKSSLYRDNQDKPAIKVYDSSKQSEVTAVAERICLLTEVRKQKVLSIRRQLREGKYDLDKKLEAAMDRVIRELRE